MRKRKFPRRKHTAKLGRRKLTIYGRTVWSDHLRAEFRVPPGVTDQIVIAAHVPNGRRRAVRTQVESLLSEQMVTAEMDRDIKEKENIRTPFRRLALQAEKLLKSAKQLDPDLRQWLSAHLTMEEHAEFLQRGEFFPKRGATEVPYEREIRRFAELARRVAAGKPKRTVSHRPRFSTGHRALRSLVMGLYESLVKNGGGKLSLWDDVTHTELKGTLPAILEILRPVFPSIIPARKALNYSTLGRMLRGAKNPPKFKLSSST
jgi:hypothetical protein